MIDKIISNPKRAKYNKPIANKYTKEIPIQIGAVIIINIIPTITNYVRA